MSSPREILATMRIDPLTLRKVAHQYTNDHWRVATVDGDIFLRRSGPARTHDAVTYELMILQRLATRGWPVPRPVGGPMVSDGRVWVAFRALPGRMRRPRSEVSRREEQRERGRLLGQLHVDLAGMADLGQKPGFARAEDSFAGLDGQLVQLSRTRPDEARALQRHLDETRQALDTLRAATREAQVIHADFSTWNLLHAGGEVSGLLDFDLSHVNHRVADFAVSWRGAHDDVVLGYTEVNPLAPIDWELLVPVFRAWYLDQASQKFVGSTIPDPQLGFVLNHVNKTPALGMKCSTSRHGS